MKVIAYLFIILLTSAICSCRSKYIPVDVARYDSVYINKTQIDSIYERDSIYVHDKGDTVTITRDRYIYRYKDRTDTIYITRTDSVPYPVEKQLTRWQQIKIKAGDYTISALIIIICIFIYKILRNKK